MAKRVLPRNPPRRVPPPVRETGIFDMEPQLTEKERRIAHRPPLINEREREHKKPFEAGQPMKWEEFPLKEHLMPLKKGQLGELPPLTTHEPFVPPKLPKRDSMLRVVEHIPLNDKSKKKKGKK